MKESARVGLAWGRRQTVLLAAWYHRLTAGEFRSERRLRRRTRFLGVREGAAEAPSR